MDMIRSIWMRMERSGLVGLVLLVLRIYLETTCVVLERTVSSMSDPDLDFKIEILGHLLEELHLWSLEEEGVAFADKKFDETLAAVKEMKDVVLNDLEEYFRYVKANNEPTYLPYYQIRKDLLIAKFGD
jgi:hypothetical protein